MSNRSKKLFSILLLVCMIVSMIPMAVSAAAPSKVYLKPSANWTQDNARFAAYFWNNSGETWVSATALEDGYYEIAVPSGYTNLIFCRMNPYTSNNSWYYVWNQSSDLTVPTDGTNCYTVKEGTWDQGGGTWSTLTTDVPEYYMVGYINGADYSGTDYLFVDGTLTVTFNQTSYVYIMDGDSTSYMTDGWLGSVTSAKLYKSSLLSSGDKLMVPAGTYTLTLASNSDGSFTLSYSKSGTTETEPEETEPAATEPAGSADDYYLFGYINGVSYGENDDYNTLGEYKFVNGKLTCTFPSDSYIGVKSGDNSHWYMTNGWLGCVSTATLYDTSVYTNFSFDKLMVPGGVELTFTLTTNADNTVTLSYVRNNRPGYTDESGIQGGLTLHVWNWSFNAIKENMELIASQGYSAIQTAPIQAVKESTTGKDMHGVWWVQYQPIDFVISTATDNPLGTASEFAAMCAEAEKYGIQVIVDVVANHMANHMSSNSISTLIPEYIRLDPSVWHDYSVNTTDYNNRYDITQHCMSGVPDLNTGSTKLQGYVIDYLKECIDAGADGFRFDGAKHIETPDDEAYFASDFWPNVIGAAEDYAESLGRSIYVYGEVLDNLGDPKLPMLAYIKHMAVTDNAWGNALRGAVSGGNAGFINTGYYKSGEADQLVVWAESHDTYATDDAGASSYNLSTAVINKTWALVAARADIMGLYFARPADFYTTTMGTASLDTGWNYDEVKAVNLFHNAFAGESEKVGNSGSIAYVVRGNSGVVLVNTSGSSKAVSISSIGLADGTYTDQISGNTFTVSGGKIAGYIGSTGIAVVYNATSDEPGSGTGSGSGGSNEGESDELDTPTVTAKSFTLSFEDEILVNLYYTVSDTTNVAEHGMLVYYSDPGIVDASAADAVYNAPVYDQANSRYMVTTEGIAAKEMGDDRYYVAYAKMKNGTYIFAKTHAYSPKKYSMNMVGKSSTSDKQKALCVAMLNYGAAAQSYFGYNTHSLMNAELTAAQKALVIPYNASLFTGAVAASSSKTTNFTASSSGFSKKTATVSFEGAFGINYYFTPSANVSGSMTLYYWSPEDYAAASRLTTSNATGSMTMVAGSDGRYWAQVSGIAAKSLDQTYYVAAVYYSGFSRYCTGVIPYSLSKYCMNNASGDMGELAQATAMYGYYAERYFTT